MKTTSKPFRYGFIVMDGNGSLFGALSGNTREILHKFSVELPKKHGRGGQSALRFARLRLEKRHNYVRKVAETAVQIFIPGGERPNVAGIVLAGSAEFKNDLSVSDLFDPRLKAIVLSIVDVSYGKKSKRATEQESKREREQERKRERKKKKKKWVPLPISCPNISRGTLIKWRFDPRSIPSPLTGRALAPPQSQTPSLDFQYGGGLEGRAWTFL